MLREIPREKALRNVDLFYIYDKSSRGGAAVSSGGSNRVIVVGAGPVGLVAALLLGRRGIPYLLLEGESELPSDLRASTFHPPTLDMLAAQGVADPLIAMGLKSPTWQIRMHESGERAEFDLAAIAADTDHPYRLQCEQSKLTRLLLDIVRAEGGDVRLGARVTGVAQDTDSVTVTLVGVWLVHTRIP